MSLGATVSARTSARTSAARSTSATSINSHFRPWRRCTRPGGGRGWGGRTPTSREAGGRGRRTGGGPPVTPLITTTARPRPPYHAGRAYLVAVRRGGPAGEEARRLLQRLRASARTAKAPRGNYTGTLTHTGVTA